MLSSLATAAGLSKPKKKFHFDVKFLLGELLNCTYLTGVIFAKIRLRDGGTFSVTSNSCDVKSHCVTWNQEFHFHSKMHGSPTTGELEPCYCKVSIRKETKGGRSYKKLGYVKINLSEYAGAGATHKKYLLESYNETKHKPDNSILRVTITLKQTSGDNLFKVPRSAGEAEWELSESPTDEGIQPDMLPTRLSYASHASAVDNSMGTLNLGCVVTGDGGSLQDIRHGQNGEPARKTASASNLRRPSISDLSITEEASKSGGTPTESSDSTPRVLSPRPLVVLKTSRSSSFNSGPEAHGGGGHHPELPPSGLAHRRMDSWSQAGTSHTPPQSKHKRQHSLVSGQSSKSTSAYSTLSERSGGSMEGGDVVSVASLRGRLTVLVTSSRMEQSRVDPQIVIDDMFSGHTFDSHETETESEGGLKMYVDKNLGTVTLAGPNLDRKNTHLQAIDVHEHKSTSPKRHRKKSLHVAKDVSASSIHSRDTSIHEQSSSPPPLPPPSSGAPLPPPSSGAPLPPPSSAAPLPPTAGSSDSTMSTNTLTADNSA